MTQLLNSKLPNPSRMSACTGLALAIGTLACAGFAFRVEAQTPPILKMRKPTATLPTPTPPPPPATPTGLGRTGISTNVGNLNRNIDTAGFTLGFGLRVKENLLAANTLDEFIEQFPNVSIPAADPQRRARSGQEQTSETAPEGGRTRNYGVTKQRFSLTTTPNEIVSFQPVAGFWLGSILEDRGLREGLGSQREVPIPATSRAPYVATIESLAIPNASRTIENPSMSTFNGAIGSMIQGAGNIDYATASSFNIVDNFDATQTALNLGLNASYMGARVRASLETNSSASRQAVTMTFVQRAFTVSMDTQGRNRASAFFNDNFTLDQAKELVNQDRWGGGVAYVNPPSYIKSITYGRAVVVNVVSNVSRATVRQFLNAAYSQPGLAVEAEADLKNLQNNERYELQITTFGGSGQQLNKLVRVVNNRQDVIRNLNEYLRVPAPLTTMVPISYGVYSLRDDKLTALKKTTEYTVTEYTPQPMGQSVTLNMRFIVGGNDGVGDSGNEIFGTVRVNGQVVARIDRAAATGNRREAGQSLELTNVTSPATPIKIDWYFGDPEPIIEAEFWDADEGSGDDRLYTRRFSLPMGALGESDTANHADTNYQGDQGANSMLRIDMIKSGNL